MQRFLAVLLACLLLLPQACGTEEEKVGGGGNGGDGGGSATGGKDAGSDAPIVNLDGGDAAPVLGCSADLQSIVDSDGNVVSTCPPDQGCAEGACVPACTAASSSRGNLGCDFRIPTPMGYFMTLPPCFALAIANTWGKAAQVSVSRGANTYDVTKFGRIPVNGQPPTQWPPVPATGIPVDQVAVLFLAAHPSSTFSGTPMKCPVATATGGPTMLDGTGESDAFVVQSDVPVSAFDVLPFGGARSFFPSAELLFPSSTWGENYVVLGTPPGTDPQPGPIWLQILASEDGTTVEILPAVDLPAGGSVPAIAQNTSGSVTLDQNRYLQWELPAGAHDVSGSIILANKPVAVFSGNQKYRQQPIPGYGGESTHQQILPVSALANEYVGAPFASRWKDGGPEPVRYRFVGAVDGTVLTWDPVLTGVPATLDRGEVADFLTPEPFVVKSQDVDHPFAMAQLMDSPNVPGGTVAGVDTAYCTPLGYNERLGDEELVIVLSPNQFLEKYVFFTDLSYATTHVVVTRKKGVLGFEDVSIDCLGVLDGWKPVGTGDEYEVTTADLVRAKQGVGTCKNGRQAASSAAPFGITVWGLDCYSSYAYPAGGNASQLSTVTVQPVPK